MGTTTAVAARPFKDATSEGIAGMLTRYEEQIARALPAAAGGLNAQRIVQIAATFIARDEKLRACDAGSVIAAVMQLAILGLNPTPQLAEGYLIPYGGSCTIQIGYRGWIAQYHRSRIVKNVSAGVVRIGDTFEYELGLEPKLRHVPVTDIGDGAGDNVAHVYAIVHFTNGSSNFVVLTKKQIEKLKARGVGGPAWRNDYESMAMAKALKQLRRFIPSEGSIDAAYASDERVFTADALSDDGNGVNLEKLQPIEPVTIAEVRQPNFIGSAGLAPTTDMPCDEAGESVHATGDDVLSSIGIAPASDIAEVDRAGRAIYGDAWPDKCMELCRDATKGLPAGLDELKPQELASVSAALAKASAKGGKK